MGKTQFWNTFDENLLIKIREVRAETSRNYKTSLKLDEDFAKEAKKQGLSKSEIINASIVKFTYGNRLTRYGAIKIMSKKDGVFAKMAQLALEDEEQMNQFIDYIKEQVESGRYNQIAEKHGEDVIKAILNN